MIVPNNYGRNMSDVCFILAEMFSSFVSLAGRVNSKSTFFKELSSNKGVYYWKWKKVSNPMGYGKCSLPLTSCWWRGISLYQIPINLFTSQSIIRTCAKMIFWYKWDKNVTSRVKSQCFNLFCFRKWDEIAWLHYYLKSTKHVASINGYNYSFVYVLVTYM